MKVKDLLNNFKSRCVKKFSVNLLNIVFFEEFLSCEKIYGCFGIRFYGKNENQKLVRRLRINFWSAIVFTIIVLILIALNLMKSVGNAEKFLESLESFGFFTILAFDLIKIFFECYWKRDAIKSIIERLEQNFTFSSYEQLHFGVHRYHRTLKTINRLSFIVYICGTFQLVILPLIFLNHEQEALLPIPVYFPLDPLQLPIYPILFVLQSWLIIVHVFAILANDILFYGLTSLISLELEVVAQKILKIDSEYDEDDACKELQNIIDTYNALIDVANKLEIVFSPLLLVNVFVGIATICITVFFVFTPIRTYFMLRFILALPPLITQVFSTCYFGEQLQSASLRVADEAYNCNWYERSLKFRKMILLTMLRAQKPQKLTGWKFLTIGMPVFYWMMKTAHSYYLFLSFLYET